LKASSSLFSYRSRNLVGLDHTLAPHKTTRAGDNNIALFSHEPLLLSVYDD